MPTPEEIQITSQQLLDRIDAAVTALEEAQQTVTEGAADLGNAVHRTGDESISGTKTFTTSPSVPAPAATDNSTKAAPTSFVQGLVTPIKNAIENETTGLAATKAIADAAKSKADGAHNDILSWLSSSGDPYARIPTFIPNRTKITVPAGTFVQIGDEIFKSVTASEITISIAAATRAGKDLYVYAVKNASGGLQFVISDNSTVPSGYTATNSRKIGGFHCLCANVGSIAGHALSGYVAGDILPASVWTLDHRPISEPEGMVYHAGTGKWYDIYLASWNGSKLVSAFNQATADGASTKKFHGELFAEEFGRVGKRLLWRHEFQTVAKGSNECTAISGAKDPNTTGGHVDSANRRMISNIGLEDCCGALWQWTSDLLEGGAYGTIAKNADGSDKEQLYLAGYPTCKYTVLQESVDGVGTDYGNCWGYCRRALVGGDWHDSSSCGSRYVNFNNASSRVSSNIGGRGVSEPRV